MSGASLEKLSKNGYICHNCKRRVGNRTDAYAHLPWCQPRNGSPTLPASGAGAAGNTSSQSRGSRDSIDGEVDMSPAAESEEPWPALDASSPSHPASDVADDSDGVERKADTWAEWQEATAPEGGDPTAHSDPAAALVWLAQDEVMAASPDQQELGVKGVAAGPGGEVGSDGEDEAGAGGSAEGASGSYKRLEIRLDQPICTICTIGLLVRACRALACRRSAAAGADAVVGHLRAACVT